MHRFRLAALVVPALAVGCQAADPSIAPLSDPRTWPVTYEAYAYSGIWKNVGDVADELDLVEAESEKADESADQGMVLLECKILQCSHAELARWTGTNRRTFALEVPAGEVPAFLAQTKGDLVSAPKLLIRPGAKGSLMVADQVAFIESFKVVGSGAALIADPVVGVATEGFEVELTATPMEQAMGVTVLANYADARLESSERAVTLPGSQAPVTLQQPVTLLQRLTTEGLLTEDRQLMLVAPANEPGDSLALFVSAQHVDQGGKLKAPDESARLWPRTTPRLVPPSE
ncbi:MAG: hypothetical protein P8M11_06275 [Planctomycetota bacterium]|nr:hypothetical protein [Planctomycetota bacterium]